MFASYLSDSDHCVAVGGLKAGVLDLGARGHLEVRPLECEPHQQHSPSAKPANGAPEVFLIVDEDVFATEFLNDNIPAQP